VRKWLTAHGRLASPIFLVGESYGGFRAVKLVRTLRERENIGAAGLLLISPALDFSWLPGSRNPLSYTALLPSFAAVARQSAERRNLNDVEEYAAGEYVSDLLKGAKDAQALSRMSANVARIAGLDPGLVTQLGGRVDARTFSRERRRGSREILSAYDAQVAGYDPAPFSTDGEWSDPVLDALRAPLGAAMTRLASEKLGWPIGDARYFILNDDVALQWDFGRQGRIGSEALSDLREALALDPKLRTLVVHGAADLVTPYFATKLMLDQLPDFGDASRLRLVVLPGGHMPYLHDDSRKSLHDIARQWLERR
jgi:carboxypeptidase C (cathepsin A)